MKSLLKLKFKSLNYKNIKFLEYFKLSLVLRFKLHQNLQKHKIFFIRITNIEQL